MRSFVAVFAILLIGASASNLTNIQAYMQGVGAYVDEPVSDLVACFSSDSAEAYFETLNLNFLLIQAYSEGNYPGMQAIGQQIATAAAGLQSFYTCAANTTQAANLLNATFGTSNFTLISLYSTTFMFVYPTQFLSNMDLVFSSINNSNFQMAGEQKTILDQSTISTINADGWNHDNLILFQTGGMIVFNLSSPAPTGACFTDAQAAAELAILEGWAAAAAASNTSNAYSNTITFFTTQTANVATFAPCILCEQALPEIQAANKILGYAPSSPVFQAALLNYIANNAATYIQTFTEINAYFVEEEYMSAGAIFTVFMKDVAATIP